MLPLLVAHAILNLELTQGVTGKISIVFVPTRAQQDKQLEELMEQDLTNSGQFATKKGTVSQFDGVTNVVRLQVHPSSANQRQGLFQVKLLLENVLSHESLLNRTFSVSSDHMRPLAHYMSDLIYQKLTGIRGSFSTKLAYVLVKQAPGVVGGIQRDSQRFQLIVADSDGANPVVLLSSSQPIMSPAWSPDGKFIAYVSFERRKAAIYLQNLMTGKRRILSDYPGINGAPAFSPNGKQIALVLSKTGYPKIYVFSLDAHHKKHTLVQETFGKSLDTEPVFSPDGQSLLFTSNRGGTPQVYQLNLMSHRIKRVTFSGNYNASASFSPDSMPNSEKIVMLHRIKQADGRSIFSIAVENLQTHQLQVLVKDNYAQSPSWSPNGQRIVYATRLHGRRVLAMISLDGQVKLTIPSSDGRVQEPVWSPFLSQK